MSSQVSHGLPSFCPQALAEALKVNKTVTDINLGSNEIGKEGAKAWCLAQGSFTSRLRNREIKWNQGFVSVVFETSVRL